MMIDGDDSLKKNKFFSQYGSVFIMLFVLIILLLLVFENIEVILPADSDDYIINANYTSELNSTYTSTIELDSVPNDADYVKVIDYIPTIYVELKYATEDNITGKAIYDFTDAYLRYGTVKKLILVQNELLKLGYSLKIWDAYRSMEAQCELWEVMPNANYIADPKNGYKGHNLGNTLDATLVSVDGFEIDMPTGFDDFTPLADRKYSDVTSTQAEHAQLLQKIMKRNGFKAYSKEWWDFTDTVAYKYDENFNP